MTDFETVMEGGSFFEGPRWHEGRWWVSDFYRHAVFSMEADGADARQELEVEGQPSGLGWMPDGSLLVVSMTDRRLLHWTDGKLSVHADLADHAGGNCNDMVVDAQGRAYVGNFGFDMMAGEEARSTVLVRVDPDGSVHVVAEDLGFPNGTVITPDGTTLIVGESMGGRYTAFTIEPDGSLTDRRVWADLPREPQPIAPDGCALDAEGRIWAADAFGKRCVLVEEGGAVLDEIAAPDGLGTYACMLGGDDGRTLLLCCAPDFLEASRAGARDAVLLATRVDVPHAGLP